MGCKIMINYRREDSLGSAGRLYDRLAQHYSRGQVFMDVDAIEPGVDFVHSIQQAVSSCDVFIAVIGPDWLTVTGRDGKRRLENPNDFVRIEIATALERNIRVIPVLVEDGEMPLAADLPADLKALARRNAIEITHTRFDLDADRLIRAIERIFEQEKQAGEVSGAQPDRAQPRNSSGAQTPTRTIPVWLWIGGGAMGCMLLIIVVFILVYLAGWITDQGQDGPSDLVQTTPPSSVQVLTPTLSPTPTFVADHDAIEDQTATPTRLPPSATSLPPPSSATPAPSPTALIPRQIYPASEDFITLPNESGFMAMTWAAGSLWHVNRAGENGELNKVSRQGASLERWSYPALEFIDGLTFDGAQLWFGNTCCGDTYGLYKVDPGSGGITQHFKVTPGWGNTNDLAWDGASIWVASVQPYRLYQVDPRNGQTIASLSGPIPPGYDGPIPDFDGQNNTSLNLRGLTWDGEFLWVSESYTFTVMQVDPISGAIIRYFIADRYPTTLTWMDDSLLIGSFSYDLITRYIP